MKQPLGFRILVLASLLVIPLQATTHEIRILRGTLVMPSNADGELQLDGTSGLRIDAAVSGAFAGRGFWGYCDLLSCLPGDVISIGTAFRGIFAGSGEVTLHGQTYSLWTVDGARGEFHFDGALVLPEFTDTDTVELSVPFTFSGSVEIPDGDEPGTYEDFELHGSGLATVVLGLHPYRTGWVVHFVTYDFTPRPNASS